MKFDGASSCSTTLEASHHAARSAWISLVCVVAGCLAMILAAQVRVPVPGSDVPMTLQLLAVFAIGFVLRPALAVSAMVLYVACGASGLPVFAGSAGLAGSTAGYIIGFIPAVWVTSAIGCRSNASIVRLFVAGLLATTAVFVLGLGWRAAFFGGLGDASLGIVIATGFTPFVGKAVVELALVVGCVRGIRRWQTGRGRNAPSDHGLDQV